MRKGAELRFSPLPSLRSLCTAEEYRQTHEQIFGVFGMNRYEITP